MGMKGYRLTFESNDTQPETVTHSLKCSNAINADIDSTVAAAMADIDAEYEALCGLDALVAA